MKRWIGIVLVALVLWNLLLTIQLNNINFGEIKQETIINNIEVSGFSTDITKIIDNSLSKLVVVANNENKRSGFIYQSDDQQSLIVTTYRAFDTTLPFSVKFDNEIEVEASVVGFDTVNNILVLKTLPNFNVEALAHGDGDLLSLGELIIALGTDTSLASSGVASVGFIEELNIFNNTGMLNRASISVTERNVGGPIINMAGEVIGFANVLNNLNSNLVTFTNINELTNIVDKILQGKTIVKHNFGMTLVDINDLTNYQKASLNLDLRSNSGLLITNVAEESIAESFGFMPGMIITSINNQEISDIYQYFKNVNLDIDQWSFVVENAGQVQTIVVTKND